MGKETVLPKNIRQIGDIRGREKICMEDYVMTYIRKKEPEEEKGYLGIFLGEKKETEDSDYIFIRGILEIPREDEKQTEDASESVPETLEEKIQKERRLYFPEWEIQGCCVIGTYPAARMEELTKAVPESCSLLYHLQEQEENFYWMKDGQYQRIRGYFVFYEQNKLMQEYMSEVFGSNSVEKESQPDRAIRNFREKIAQKSEKKSRSMLKLASSFFVVTVLVVGAVVVNRIEDIRNMQSLPAEVSGYQNAEAVSNSNAVLDADALETAVNAVGSTVLNTADTTPEQELLDFEDELAGSASFWDETYEDTAADAAGSTVSDNVSVTASADNNVSADAVNTASSDNVGSADAASTASSDNVGSADAAGTASADNAASVNAASTTSADNAASANTSAAAADNISADSLTAQDTSAAADSSAAQNISVSAELPEAQEASSMRQTYAAYVIREGDTLADICSRYYGDLNHLEEICEVNGIEDANRIMPGQKIVLP